MPFLRAKLIPHKDNRNNNIVYVKNVECDEKIAEAVKAWLREDDLSTAQELARLGL